MDQVVFTAQKRVDTGSRNTARLRKRGRVPAVVYGRSGQAQSLDLDALEFTKAIKGISESTIVKLNFDGAGHDAFVKDTQFDIISGRVVHVDFYEVDSTKLVRAKVPLHLSGVAAGVREGGIIENPLHEVEVECFPRFLPEGITIDVSELRANQSIHVRDLKLAPEVKILSSGDQVIVLVKYAKAEVEVAPEVAAAPAAAAATGAKSAPGASPAAAAAPAAGAKPAAKG
jgi:large subunit ribosomal protein L25